MGTNLFGFDPERFSDWEGFYSGEDYGDPLGWELQRKKLEEEQRLRESGMWGMKRPFIRGLDYLNSLGGFNISEDESGNKSAINTQTGEPLGFGEAAGSVLGTALGLPKNLLSDIPISALSGLKSFKPSEQLLAEGVFPKRLPGDEPISQAREVAEGFGRGGLKTAARFGLDPTVPLSFGEGYLASLLGANFGYQGIKGGSEQLGKAWSEVEGGNLSSAAEVGTEGLGSLLMGTMGLSGLKHSIPEVKLPGGYSSRSPINLRPSFDRLGSEIPVLPNTVSAMAEGGLGSDKPGILEGLIEEDPLAKRVAEIKEAGVLYNPTGKVPTKEILYHGTGNRNWATGEEPLNKPAIDEYNKGMENLRLFTNEEAGTPESILAALAPETQARVKWYQESTGESNPFKLLHLIDDPKVRAEIESALQSPISEARVQELAAEDYNLRQAPPVIEGTGKFGSRAAAPTNMVGGTAYFSKAPAVAEAGYTKGENAGLIQAEVTRNKTLDLNQPKPRDFDIRGRALILKAIREATNPKQVASLKQLYEQFVNDKTSWNAQETLGHALELIDPTDTYRYSNENLSKPLFERGGLSDKDKVNKMLRDELGYDSLIHDDTSTYAPGQEPNRNVVLFDPRHQAKILETTPLKPFGERSTVDILDQLESLKPTAKNADLIDNLTSELYTRSKNLDPNLNVPYRDRLNRAVDAGIRMRGELPYNNPAGALTPEELNSLTPEEIMSGIKSKEIKTKQITPDIIQRLVDATGTKQVYDFFNEHNPFINTAYPIPKPSAKPFTSTGQEIPPSKLLHDTLKGLNLSKFTPRTLVETFKASGIDIDEASLGPILDELVQSGVLNRKATGTYTLQKYPSSGIRKVAPEASQDLGEALQQSVSAPVKPLATGIGSKNVSVGKQVESLDGKLKGTIVKIPNSFSNDKHVRVQWDNGANGTISISNLREPTVEQSLANPTLRAKDAPPIAEGVKPIELGDWIEGTSKALGWKPDPFSNTRSQAVTPSDPKQLVERIFKQRYGEDWEKKLTDDDRVLINDVARGTLSDKSKSHMAAIVNDAANQTTTKRSIPLTASEKRKLALAKKQEELLAQDPEIAALKDSMMMKPASEMAGREGELPAEPPMHVGTGIVPESPKGKVRKKSFSVTLDDGTIHRVKAATADEAREFAQGILEHNGSEKRVQDVKEFPDSLTRAAQTPYSQREVKEIDSITKAQDVSEIKTEAEYQKLYGKTKKQMDLQRERAVEKELRDKIRVEEAFKKAEEKRLRDEEKKAKRLNVKSEETGWLDNPVVKVLNAAKSLAFGGDVGHLLRQGKQMNADLLFSKHAKKVLDQFPVIFRAMKSEEYFKTFHENLYKDSTIKRLVDDFGLDMPGLGKHLKEEVFHGAGLAEQIPLLGRFYAKPSERAYTAGLNFLRASEAKKLVESLQKQGYSMEKNPEKFKAIARAINIISQRGDFNPAYQKVFSDASAIFGAPRAKASRLQNAVELFRGGESGKVVRQTAAKTMAFNIAMIGMLRATLGDKVEFETDSEKSDFGKIKIGDKITIDPWVGLGVTARTVAKLHHGKVKSAYTGKTRVVSPGQAVTDEFLGGLAPGIRLAWELMTGTDTRGFQVSRIKALGNIAPLTARQITELLKSGDTIEALELSLLQGMGEGVDTFDYDEAQKEQKALKEERGLGTKKKKKSSGGSYSYPF